MTNATIRDLIGGLTELAAMLPEGLDTPVQIGICNAEDLQLIEKVDLDQWTYRHDDSTPDTTFVLLRGHAHPWEVAGQVLHGAASDDELRKLMGDDE